MKRTALFFACFLLVGTVLQAPGRAQQQAVAKSHLKVGDVAPDFTLLDQNRKPISLSDFWGKKNVILAFYVMAFSPN